MLSRSKTLPLLAGLTVLAGYLTAPISSASAQGLTSRYGGAPSYGLELEPHLVAGIADPPGRGVEQGAGAGVRGSVVVSRDGFLRNANDSIAIGFGLDVLHYRGQPGSLFGSCVQRAPGPGGTSVCTAVDVPGAPANYLFVPVVMQWNIWPTPQFSVFGEPGLALFLANRGGPGLAPSISVGGRFRPSEAFTMVLRLGWPTTTLGISFFL